MILQDEQRPEEQLDCLISLLPTHQSFHISCMYYDTHAHSPSLVVHTVNCNIQNSHNCPKENSMDGSPVIQNLIYNFSCSCSQCESPAEFNRRFK